MLCIVQSRMSSSRLPGKSLKIIDGFPILNHVLKKLLRVKLITNICVATSSSKSDEPLVNYCKKI